MFWGGFGRKTIYRKRKRVLGFGRKTIYRKRKRFMVGLVENNSKKRKRVAKLTLILLCSDSFQRMKGSYQDIVNLEGNV